jgi:hypothetical protein
LVTYKTKTDIYSLAETHYNIPLLFYKYLFDIVENETIELPFHDSSYNSYKNLFKNLVKDNDYDFFRIIDLKRLDKKKFALIYKYSSGYRIAIIENKQLIKHELLFEDSKNLLTEQIPRFIGNQIYYKLNKENCFQVIPIYTFID